MIVLRHVAKKICEQELCLDRVQRGLQKIKVETKQIGVGPVGGGSHGSLSYGSRA